MSLVITDKAHERLSERLSKEYEDSVARVVLNGFG